MRGAARMTPVRPPNRKVTRKPQANSIGVSKLTWPFHMVPIQLKNLRPVGIAIRNVMKLKNGSRTAPVANMWCAHTAADSAAIASILRSFRGRPWYTIPRYPKMGCREKTGTTSEMIPKKGKAGTTG